MKRSMRMTISAWILLCGCAGRVNTDLLQARIRQQATQLSETQREIEKTRSELKQSRIETAQLKSELAEAGNGIDASPDADSKICKVHILPLATGGLNKDEFAGDDSVVVLFVPLDRDSEPTKQPGDVELKLLDPRLPESERIVGHWKFSAEECRTHWTRGIAGSGFQFNLPLEQTPRNPELVVKLRFKTADEQCHEASHLVKLIVPTGQATVHGQRSQRRPVKFAEELNEPLPPVGDVPSNSAESDLPGWALDDTKAPTARSGTLVRHSANWTDATIPQLR